ncbi:MAG: hypothetical protein ACO1SV_12440 [Fimbriimonas sp.]
MTSLRLAKKGPRIMRGRVHLAPAQVNDRLETHVLAADLMRLARSAQAIQAAKKGVPVVEDPDALLDRMEICVPIGGLL